MKKSLVSKHSLVRGIDNIFLLHIQKYANQQGIMLFENKPVQMLDNV